MTVANPNSGLWRKNLKNITVLCKLKSKAQYFLRFSQSSTHQIQISNGSHWDVSKEKRNNFIRPSSLVKSAAKIVFPSLIWLISAIIWVTNKWNSKLPGQIHCKPMKKGIKDTKQITMLISKYIQRANRQPALTLPPICSCSLFVPLFVFVCLFVSWGLILSAPDNCVLRSGCFPWPSDDSRWFLGLCWPFEEEGVLWCDWLLNGDKRCRSSRSGFGLARSSSGTEWSILGCCNFSADGCTVECFWPCFCWATSTFAWSVWAGLMPQGSCCGIKGCGWLRWVSCGWTGRWGTNLPAICCEFVSKFPPESVVGSSLIFECLFSGRSWKSSNCSFRWRLCDKFWINCRSFRASRVHSNKFRSVVWTASSLSVRCFVGVALSPEPALPSDNSSGWAWLVKLNCSFASFCCWPIPAATALPAEQVADFQLGRSVAAHSRALPARLAMRCRVESARAR